MRGASELKSVTVVISERAWEVYSNYISVSNLVKVVFHFAIRASKTSSDTFGTFSMKTLSCSSSAFATSSSGLLVVLL